MTTLQDIQQMITARDLEKAATTLKNMAQKNWANGMNWNGAMSLAASLGDDATALICARNYHKEAENDPGRIVALIDALMNVAKFEEAEKLATQLKSDQVIAADGHFLHGALLARHGKRDSAIAEFKKAIALFPQHGSAWEQIALLSSFNDLQQDIATMETTLGQIMQSGQKIPMHFALARAYDQQDDIENAWRHYSAGAAMRRQDAAYDTGPVIKYMQRLATSFDEATINELRNEAGGDALTFIISAPRSGSTLLEQILATAPGVTPTGEHTLLRYSSLALRSMEPVDMQAARSMKHAEWRKIAQSYETAIRKRFGPARHYTDKTMINYWYVGLISIIFPKAKLVWCERDIRDVAWSCFRSRINGNRWAEQLDDTAEFLKAHKNLCEHWMRVCGSSITHVRYEDLVSSPDETTDALFAHTGLEKPDNWQDFHLSQSPVATASLAQVRRPLTSDAVGSWRRYEKFLAPVYDKHFN